MILRAVTCIQQCATLRSSNRTASRKLSIRSGNEAGKLAGPLPSRASSETKGAVWERMAVAVKLTDQETSSYIETIRATHDPALHIKTVEEELKGTIGKALGRQGEKVLRSMRLMEQELQNYESLVKRYSPDKQHPEIIQSANTYNEYRKQALQARWELTVHRQAIGFIVNNHNYVTQHYPIGPALPILDESQAKKEESSPPPRNSSLLKDQLPWWERVGRWR